MQTRSLTRSSLFALSPMVLAAFVACSTESPNPDDDGETAGEGGTAATPSSGGAGGELPVAGAAGDSGGVAGEAATPVDSGGAGGEPAAGTGGSSGESGSSGAGGEQNVSSCTNEDGSCKSGCHELALVTGCGDDQESATLCSALTPVATSCGVRLSDDRVFYVDAPYESADRLVGNPFATADDFRPCTQAEVDASDCRDHADETSARSARFVLQNTSTEDRWVLVGGEPCAPFDVKQSGDSLALVRGNACADSECNGLAADSVKVETWERVAAGASVTLTWDGLELESFATIDVCEPDLEENEVERSGDGRCVAAAQRASAAGTYTVTLGARSSDPALEDEASCEDERCSVPLDIWPSAALYPACRTGGADTTNVTFELPETGEAVVEIELE